jgi:xylulokinase
MSSNPLFLGLDLSTQQLKAVITDRHYTVVHEASIHFDADLPLHGTTGGVLKGPEDGQVTSPVEMWLGAIDLLFKRMENAGVDLSAIVAMSGACQVWSFVLS